MKKRRLYLLTLLAFFLLTVPVEARTLLDDMRWEVHPLPNGDLEVKEELIYDTDELNFKRRIPMEGTGGIAWDSISLVEHTEDGPVSLPFQTREDGFSTGYLIQGDSELMDLSFRNGDQMKSQRRFTLKYTIRKVAEQKEGYRLYQVPLFIARKQDTVEQWTPTLPEGSVAFLHGDRREEVHSEEGLLRIAPVEQLTLHLGVPDGKKGPAFLGWVNSEREEIQELKEKEERSELMTTLYRASFLIYIPLLLVAFLEYRMRNIPGEAESYDIYSPGFASFMQQGMVTNQVIQTLFVQMLRSGVLIKTEQGFIGNAEPNSRPEALLLDYLKEHPLTEETRTHFNIREDKDLLPLLRDIQEEYERQRWDYGLTDKKKGIPIFIIGGILFVVQVLLFFFGAHFDLFFAILAIIAMALLGYLVFSRGRRSASYLQHFRVLHADLDEGLLEEDDDACFYATATGYKWKKQGPNWLKYYGEEALKVFPEERREKKNVSSRKSKR